MDPDFAILCAVRESPLGGPATWARSAGLGTSALRRRLKRLQDIGVLQGFSALPAASVFDRRPMMHHFEAPDGIDVDAVLAVEDVAWLARTLEGNVYVATFEATVCRLPDLEAVLGPAHSRIKTTPRSDPGVLGRIDLKVLRELLREPRATVQALCDRTGLSAKTVRAHREHLVAGGAVDIEPLLRTPSTPGRLFYNFVVEVDAPEHRRSVASAVPHAVLITEYDAPPVAYMFGTAAGLPEQSQQVQATLALPHVVDVRMLINQEFAVAVDRLVAWCDERIEAWGAAARAGRPT